MACVFGRRAVAVFVGVMALMLLSASVAEARPYTLEWDVNTDGVTAGYRVYFGTAPGTYQPVEGIDVGNVPEFQVDLTPGQTYYFVVRAYNADDELGPTSDEFAFFVPTVGISTDLPSPQTPGAQVTVNATGLSGGFEYQFVRQSPSGVWSIVQPYSPATSFAWNTTGEVVGIYTFQVWARPVGASVEYETYAGMGFELVSTIQAPVTAVAIETNVSSPQFTGTQITVTANATGSTGNYQYQFLLRNPAGVWTIAQAYGSAPSWIWNTTGGPTGAYSIQVFARNAGSSSAYEAYTGTTFGLVPPPASPVSAVSVTTNVPSPQVVGTPITVIASATGTSDNYQYQFVLRNPAGVWTVVRAYSSAQSWIWNTTGGPTGAYSIQVWARNAGSTSAYEAYSGMSFDVASPTPVAAVGLTTNVPSPQVAGTTITLTANATGTTGNYEYQFILRDTSGVWTIAQAYSSAPSWIWNTSGRPAGAYIIQVWARNAGSTTTVEAFTGMQFDVVSPPPVSGVGVTTNVPPPQTAGTPITVTANATGATGNYEYQFILRDTAGIWTIVQAYSSTPSWIWNTSGRPAGAYSIQVWARNAGSTIAYEAYSGTSFELLTGPPVTGPVTAVQASLSVPSPQPAGEHVTTTANAIGTSGSYEYFFAFRNSAGVWTVVQDYSTTPSWTWETEGQPPGTYLIQVWARDVGSSSAYEAFTGFEFTIN